MSKQLYQPIYLVLIFLLTACSGNNSKTAIPSASAKLLPADMETGKIEGQKLKIEFPCLDMGKMDYFTVTVVGDAGYSTAYLKKTETKIVIDDFGKTISKLIVEYLAKDHLETIGNLLVLLEGEVHPHDFRPVTFIEGKAFKAAEWLTADFQKPLAKSLRGDKEDIKKCYGYQWQEKSGKTVLFGKATRKGKCKTSATKIELEKMTRKTAGDFKLLESNGSQVLYWKEQLVFVSQGAYSKAAAKPLYSFTANGETNYITYFGVKRKNLYGLLNIKGEVIRLDLFPSC